MGRMTDREIQNFIDRQLRVFVELATEFTKPGADPGLRKCMMQNLAGSYRTCRDLAGDAGLDWNLPSYFDDWVKEGMKHEPVRLVSDFPAPLGLVRSCGGN